LSTTKHRKQPVGRAANPAGSGVKHPAAAFDDHSSSDEHSASYTDSYLNEASFATAPDAYGDALIDPNDGLTGRRLQG